MIEDIKVVNWKPGDYTVSKVYFYVKDIPESTEDILKTADIVYSKTATRKATKAERVYTVQTGITRKDVEEVLAGNKKTANRILNESLANKSTNPYYNRTKKSVKEAVSKVTARTSGGLSEIAIKRIQVIAEFSNAGIDNPTEAMIQAALDYMDE